MNDRDIWEEVCEWMCHLTGLPVILAFQGEERPPKHYLSVNLMRINEVRERAACVEFETLPELNDQGFSLVREIPVIETEWVFTVESYGSGDDDNTAPLRKIRSAQHLLTPITRLNDALVLFDTSEIKYQPKYINGMYERRAQIKIFVRGFTRDGQLVDVIEELPITCTRKH